MFALSLLFEPLKLLLGMLQPVLYLELYLVADLPEGVKALLGDFLAARIVEEPSGSLGQQVLGGGASSVPGRSSRSGRARPRDGGSCGPCLPDAPTLSRP